MIHNPLHVKSLKTYIQRNRSFRKTVYEFYNGWIKTEHVDIHDFDTANYYLAMIPMLLKED